MLYCERCLSLAEPEQSSAKSACPTCGRPLRVPAPDDSVLLARESFIRASMLEPLLKDAGIPYQRMGRMGDALVRSAGALLELYSFYVPFSTYDEAVALWQVACGDPIEEEQPTDHDEEKPADGV